MFLQEIQRAAPQETEEGAPEPPAGPEGGGSPERGAPERPEIMHLFAFRPDKTEHLSRFTHEVMRGASELSPGQRELIAAFTSDRNGCPF